MSRHGTQGASVGVPSLAAILLLVVTPWTLAGTGECLAEAAREQVGVTLIYDGSYARLPYPGGDVPLVRGVCTDLVVRAYRRLGVDLQRLVHEDMVAAWDAYPKLWGLGRPDPSIDHRRVPNLATFFGRRGGRLAVAAGPTGYAPGDLVTWRLPSGNPHIGIVSDRHSRTDVPLIIHNIGAGAAEEDTLFAFPITGHYRYLPDPVPETCSIPGHAPPPAATPRRAGGALR